MATPLANQTNGDAAANIKPAPIMGRCKIQATAAMTNAIESESKTLVPTGNLGSGASADKNWTRDTEKKICTEKK